MFPKLNDFMKSKTFRFALVILCCLATRPISAVPPNQSAAAALISVYPEQAKDFTRSLNGDWSFKYIPSLDAGVDADFYQPDFNVSAWKKISVPSNWELQGFAEPRYDTKLADGLGLYRRTFRVPAAWRGSRRVCLRFEGVAYGFDAWVNGKKVGQSEASAYNPDTFDITDALQSGPNADNVLAVQVTTKPLGWEFDVNDDWSLSGIYRDVTLFSVPATYMQDITTSTKLTADGSADLTVSATVNQPGAKLQGKLLAPDGKKVSEFDLVGQANGNYGATVHVVEPQLWTAETPALYRLRLTLSADGKALQTIEQRIGLREISIVDGVLLLNGRPIKLRGVTHHDIDPVDGRAMNEAEERNDLELMRKGNINFVRTSHYPPQPFFLDLCDQLGFYVMDEVPIGRGEKHDNDPDYRTNIMARVEATITRDKNHPSVIVWSIGNENPETPLLMDAARHAKELDPTRPICFPETPSVFEKNYRNLPKFVDLYSPHYPTDAELLDQAQTLTDRPTIYSEYAHAWGLAMDRVQFQWGVMQRSPHLAGGNIWEFEDQGILRTSKTPVDLDKPTMNVWVDKTHYYDMADAAGTDGIVYANRVPQVDFWEVRKVYAPVRIPERSAAVKPGAQKIPLTIENRYDFISLTGMKLAWSLQRDGKELQHGHVPLHAASHEQETLQIPVHLPAIAGGDVLTLNLRCLDAKGLQINERTVQLNFPGADRGAWASNLPAAGVPRVTESDSEVKIELPQWVLTVERATGALSIKDQAGNMLVAGIYPHTGRKFTMVDERNAAGSSRAKKIDIWPMPMLTNLDAPVVKVTKDGSAVKLSVSGRYPRPDAPDQALVGGYQAEIVSNSVITISYEYNYEFKPTKAMSIVLEAGLSVVVPDSLSEFRWIGQGPYPAYPGKDRLDEFGLFHLNREDLHFQGNRRETELALLTTPAGAGVALATSSADVAVERDGDQTLLSQNALLSGLGNKGWLPETFIDLTKTPRIAGQFTLVPLGDKWPAQLTRWFGKPSAAKNIFHPFYDSYDQ